MLVEGPIPISTALLGGDIEIPSLDGAQTSRGDPSIAHLIVEISTPLAIVDLLLAALIMVSILLLGRRSFPARFLPARPCPGEIPAPVAIR
jgi:hypothetical protein